MCRMKNEALPNGSLVADDQLAAAIAAAPYIHPKLAAAVFKGEVRGADGGPIPLAALTAPPLPFLFFGRCGWRGQSMRCLRN